jgi:hypothetical protein
MAELKIVGARVSAVAHQGQIRFELEDGTFAMVECEIEPAPPPPELSVVIQDAGALRYGQGDGKPQVTVDDASDILGKSEGGKPVDDSGDEGDAPELLKGPLPEDLPGKSVFDALDPPVHTWHQLRSLFSTGEHITNIGPKTRDQIDAIPGSGTVGLGGTDKSDTSGSEETTE